MEIYNCPECGNKLVGNETVCPECGMPIETTSKNKESIDSSGKEEEKKKKSIKRMIIGVAALVCIIAIGIAVFIGTRPITFLKKDGTIIIPQNAKVVIETLTFDEKETIDHEMKKLVSFYNSIDISKKVEGEKWDELNDLFSTREKTIESDEYLPMVLIYGNLAIVALTCKNDWAGDGKVLSMIIDYNSWNSFKDSLLQAAEYYYQGKTIGEDKEEDK